jgi:hypothetical protein
MNEFGASGLEADAYRATAFREVLNRGLVLEYVDRLLACIDEHLASTDEPMEYDGVVATEEDLTELRARIAAIMEQYGKEAAAEGWAGLARSFFPRSPDLAFIQARLTECATRFVSRRVGQGPELGDMDENAPLPEPLPALAGTSFPRRSVFGAELFDAFEPCDPRWAICLWSKFRRRRMYPFNPLPAVAPLGDRARIVVVGDWGSGLPRALALGEAIAERLDDEGDGRDTHVVHLGDTYYVGSPEEQRDHVLRAWPQPTSTHIRSWAVPGNHDYYSGGEGFFETLLTDDRFAEQRSSEGTPTSIFELANDYWRVLGLDTGWKDHDLVPDEWSWLEQSLEDAMRCRQKVILLSHHQAHSAFAHPNPEFADRVLDLLRRYPVEAWFWGHEHRCTIYEPISGIARPRCVGNGGVPEWVDTRTASGVIADCQEEYLDPTDDETWRQFAYAIVDLDDDVYSARYVTETGAVWFQESSPA